MDNWIFMLCMVIWIPLIMVFFGRRFSKKPPKNINFIFGYRSSMSMKNKDMWEFSHRYWGKIVSVFGVAFIPGSIISMLLVMNESSNTIDLVATCVCVIQTLALTCSIIPVEYALKKTFDSEGNRKK